MKKNVMDKVMGSVRWGLPFCLMALMPLSMSAQDDDLYFMPKKQKNASTVERITETQSTATQYEGLNLPVDEYNRRPQKSMVEVIDGDSTKLDIIDFTEGMGVYPDSLAEDFKLTKKMQRFDDYNLADNAAFWAGYHAGRSYWYSPWYYTRYGWGWYDPWYDPWYYRSWYGWYDPWYYGYGYYGWYSPYYYAWGWPYYYGWGYYGGVYPYYYGGGGSGHYYGHTGNAGTIDIRGGHGRSRVMAGGGRSSHGGGFSSRNSSRQSSMRDRAIGFAALRRLQPR